MRKSLLHISVFLLLIIFLTGCGKKQLESITLNVSSKSIPINETKRIQVTYVPQEVQEPITWSSSNEEVASVNDGIVTAKSVGNVIISATTTSGIRSQISFDVYKKVESITLDKKEVELYVGDTYQLNAVVSPEDATYKDVSWKSLNSTIASVENGLITAKSVGDTVIAVSTVGDDISERCTVTVKEKPIVFSGSGDKIIKNINIPNGSYKAVMSNSGRSNFIVKFYEDLMDKYGDLIANEIGAYNGSVVIKDGETHSVNDGMLEIKSSGKWSIKFERISGTIEGNKVTGKGDVVTGWFSGTSGRKVATFTNSGKSNFIVRIYDEYGDRDLLVNEIGSYNGQATFVTTPYSKYYFEVSSSGSWSISWE